MQRRTFLAAGSALLLPTWRLVPEWFDDAKPFPFELLQQFCDPEGLHRYDITEPFVQKGFASATDARVAIRVEKCAELIDVDSEARIPPLDGIFEDKWQGDRWRPWPRANYVGYPNGFCWRCDGYGKIDFTWCGECEGEGVTPVVVYGTRLGFDKCPSCTGGKVGGVVCPCCNGASIGPDAPSMQFLDKRTISPKYHQLITQLPGAEYSLSCDPEEMVSIRFDGGQCALMPMCP